MEIFTPSGFLLFLQKTTTMKFALVFGLSALAAVCFGKPHNGNWEVASNNWETPQAPVKNACCPNSTCTTTTTTTTTCN
uniref:Uncharacterized protein n=1 Tax=Panagrolaimus superbus TaxID=310955 RepID=A0A914YGS7_9BILA